MSPETELPDITEEENVARYIFFRSHIRQTNPPTVKPDAFIPHPYPDLSVTRHLQLTETDLWRIGQEIAGQRSRTANTPTTLHGRADVGVSVVTQQNLLIQSDPAENNPNHAIIIGWPKDRPAQKIMAQVLSARAGPMKTVLRNER